jgi:hypothetical protein
MLRSRVAGRTELEFHKQGLFLASTEWLIKVLKFSVFMSKSHSRNRAYAKHMEVLFGRIPPPHVAERFPTRVKDLGRQE